MKEPLSAASIFISYRRSDSKAETERIYDFLVNEFGPDSVFKDVNSIPPGLDFAEYIDQTLLQCLVVLVVIGKTWLTVTEADGTRRLDNPDDFVRIEVETALRCNIPVIPVLLDGASIPKRSELPESLQPISRRNGAQVGYDPRFKTDMARLVEGMQKFLGGYERCSSRKLKPGAPFQAPPLPRHYVPRPKHFEAVKNCLLEEDTPDALVITAIYGMGGIGKSVLAAALVQDSKIQMNFPDGVLWVTLGQQPDMLSMVNLWIRELGNYDYNPTTLQAASLHLRTLLADKQALLVVDDVWNPQHVEPFRIGGSGCRVLVTTRQTRIIGATRYDLDLMTPQQSLDLLTKCLSQSLSDTEQTEAETFAREVGYLPLALELAAAQIEYGVTWEELLEAFQSEMTNPEALDLDNDVESISDEAIRKRRSLVASFKLTLKLLSPQLLAQFAWLGIMPEDVSLTQQMAATLWGVKSLQAGAILRELRNRALLLPQVQRPGKKPTYRIHDLVHDLAKNLLTHQQYLGELQGLGLKAEQAHAQFLEHYRGQTQDGLWHTMPDDGYIHAHLAWHFEQAQQPDLLHQLLKESTPEGRNGWYEACERLGQTANFVTDVARAWQAAEVFYEQNELESIALQCRYALITTSLNSLAQNIPPAVIAVFVQKRFWAPAQGLAYVRQVQKPHQRAEALGALAPHLPKGLMDEAVAVARTIQSESFQASALSVLAQYVPEVVSEAVTLARTIQSDYYRAFALSVLAQSVSESLMGEVLNVARTIQDEYYRATALSGIALYVPESLIVEALAVVRTIQSEYYRASALNMFAQFVPELVSEVLDVARTIQDEYYRASVLCGLAKSVPEALMGEALAVARTIQEESARASALSGLAEYLPEVVSEAVAVARMIQDKYYRASALGVLAQYLPEVVSEAVAVARTIQDEYYRATALSGLAQYVPEVVSEVLLVARTIQSESARAAALSGLAQYVPKSLMSEALSVARTIQSGSDRAIVLSGLAQHVPESLMNELLSVARMIQDEYCRVIVLSGLTLYLPEMVSEAVVVARTIQSETARASALSGLAQYMSESQMSEALSVVRTIQSEYRATALSGLAQYVPESLMNKALSVARSIQSKSDQASALSSLVQYMPEVVSEALAVARSIQSKSDQASALSSLAQYMPEVVSEAVVVARTIQSKSDRASALSGLAQYVPEVVSEVLAVVRTIQGEYGRATALSGLAQYVPESLMGEALAVTRTIQSEYFRTTALSSLAQYVPEVLSEALAVARTIQDEYFRASALSGLAQYMPEVVSEALLVTRMIQSKSDRACALRGLAQYVPESLMSEALSVVCTIQSESDRASVLSGLLPQLKQIETDIVLWQEIMHTLAYQDRKGFVVNIPKLSPAIISLSGEIRRL